MNKFNTSTLALALVLACSFTLGCDIEEMVEDALPDAPPNVTVPNGTQNANGVAQAGGATGQNAAYTGADDSEAYWNNGDDTETAQENGYTGEGDGYATNQSGAGQTDNCFGFADCIIECPDTHNEACFDQCIADFSEESVMLFNDMAVCFSNSGCYELDYDQQDECLQILCGYEINNCADHTGSETVYENDNSQGYESNYG